MFVDAPSMHYSIIKGKWEYFRIKIDGLFMRPVGLGREKRMRELFDVLVGLGVDVTFED